MRVNEAKSVQVTRREMCPPVTLNGLKISQAQDAKYLRPRSQTELQKVHIHQAKTTWNSTEQDVLAARQQVATLNQK